MSRNHLYILVVVVVSALFAMVDSATVSRNVLIGVLLIVTVTNWRNINIAHISCILLIITLIEYLVFFIFFKYWAYSSFFGNAVIYMIHSMLDSIVIWAMYNRDKISRYVLKKQGYAQELGYKIFTDSCLVVVFTGFLVIDVAAFSENLLRNLHELGVSRQIAEPFWNVYFIYDLYLPIKNILNSITISIIVLSVYALYVKPRQLRAQQQR